MIFMHGKVYTKLLKEQKYLHMFQQEITLIQKS